jgi:CDP-paratose 2-epimerase
MNGTTILITGGAGFLGSNLVAELAARDNRVIIADDFSRRGSEYNFRKLAEAHPGIAVHKVDIADMPLVIAKERPDIVYHFAAQVAVTTSVVSPESDFRINAEGSFRIAKAAHDFDIPVVYTSTNKVYGDNVNAVPLTELPTRWEFEGAYFKKGLPESFPIDASHHTPYGVSKLVGEMYVREYGGIANRCSCMYGPFQHGIIDQGWISFFILRKLRGEPVTIFGDGKQVRDGVHAKDVVMLLLAQGASLLADRTKLAGEVFNVGGGHENTTSLLELCERLKIEPAFDEWRPADQKVFYCDVSKAERAFGWTPTVKLADGIDELVEWSKEVVGVH